MSLHSLAPLIFGRRDDMRPSDVTIMDGNGKVLRILKVADRKAVLCRRHERQERLRESGKFLHTCASPDFATFTHFGRVAVLGEEFGEVCRAALDVEKIAEGRYDTGAAASKLRKELIEVAAVAIAYIEALDSVAP
jgi:hypothetical protein